MIKHLLPPWQGSFRRYGFLLFLFLSLFFTAGAFAQDAYTNAGLPVPTVKSDKDDYIPGEIALISGTGWTKDQQVDLHFEETPMYHLEHQHDYHGVNVDANGNWTIKYPIESRHLGVAFEVHVVGKQTAYEAYTYFTDATVEVTGDKLWSELSVNAIDVVRVKKGATLTIDVPNALCSSLELGWNSGSSGDRGNGTVKFIQTSNLTVSGNVILGNVDKTGTISMIDGGTLKIGGQLVLTSNFSSFNSGTGTIEYNAAANQTITPTTYNNLITSGSGIKTLGGNITLTKNLTISSGTNLTAGANTINIAGNISNSGIINPGVGTVHLNGASPQSIAGSNQISFNKLIVNNNSGIVISQSTLVNSLAIQSGKISLNNYSLNIQGTNSIIDATNGEIIAISGNPSLIFSNSATISGSLIFGVNVFINNGTVNFSNNSLIKETLFINSKNSFVSNPPLYATHSRLTYTIAENYLRGPEWSTITGNGSPYNVQIGNHTVLRMGANPVQLNGALSLNTNATLDMGDNSHPLVTRDLLLQTIDATLILSTNTSSSLDIKGNGQGFQQLFSRGNIIQNGRKIILSGSGDLNLILNKDIQDLVINKTSGNVIISDFFGTRNLTITGSLTFGASNKANINAGNGTITIANSLPNSIIKQGDGFAIGNLQRAIATGTNSYLFPVGDETKYTPVTIDINNATTTGNLTVSTLAAQPPVASGISQTKYVNRKWAITNNGVTFGASNATFNFVSGDLTGSPATDNFIIGKFDGTSWSSPTVGTKTATSTQATGLTSFSEFVVGETATQNTSTALASSLNPSKYGESVTLTATVETDPTSTNVPVGTVQFYNGVDALGSPVTLNTSGVATLGISTLAVSSTEGHSITAKYIPANTSFNSSTSAAIAQVVNKAPATITLGSLRQIYNGSSKSATATTVPAGLTTVGFTYAPITLVGGVDQVGTATSEAPTNAGRYQLVATLTNDNYTGSQTGTLVIDPMLVVITPTAGQKKEYGQSDPTFTFSNNASLADGAFGSTKLGRESGSNVGTYAYTLGNLSAGPNYSLHLFNATPLATFAITPKPLTPAVVANDKFYDGNTSATLSSQSVSGMVNGETAVGLVVGAVSFDNKNIGTRTATASNLSLSGTAASNYVLAAGATAADDAEIKAVQLTPAVVANDKFYDGNTSATLSSQSVSGMIGTEEVSLVVGAVSFNNKNIGTRTATASNLSLSGTAASNYVLAAGATAADDAEIKAVQLTPAVVANDKFYDGNTSATLSSQSVSGMVNGETAVGLVVGAVSFDNKNIGTRTATASNLSLSGTAASNYVLAAGATAADDAEIKAVQLTPAVVANDKFYDGNTSATLSSQSVSGMIGTEEVSLVVGAVSFDNKNIGTRTATASNLSLSGTAASNYVLAAGATAADDAEIKQKPLTVTAVTATKDYDGGVTSTGLPTVGTLASGDEVNAAAKQVYDNKNVGTTHVMTASGLTIKDASGVNMTGNYDISYQTVATGIINPKAASVTPNAISKVYGTSDPELTGNLTGFVSEDGITAEYSRTPGNLVEGSPYTISAALSSESALTNYSITYNTANFTITRATTTTSLITSAGSVRYMDNLTMTAQIKPLNTVSALTGSVEFKIGSVSYGTVAVVPVPGATDGTVQATLIKQVAELPANYTVAATFVSTNSNYSGSDAIKSLEVRQRTAVPRDLNAGFYTGDVFAWTTSSTSSKATVTLIASLRDMVLPAGDLRAAKVTFYYVNGSTLTPIPSAKDIPVGLVDVNDGSVGFATATVQFDIGSSNAQDYQVAVGVSGAYTNTPSMAQAIITVSKPVPGGFIVGGSQITNVSSSGYIKGHKGLNTDYQFDIQYTKSGANPKGKAKVMIRSYYKPDGTLDNTEHTYWITTNAISTLNITKNSDGSATGAFSAKANLVEQLEDMSIVAIEGGATFQMEAYQKNCDQEVAITLFRKSGGIWFSSNWNGSKTIRQDVNSTSKVFVEGGGTISCTTAPTTLAAARKPTTDLDLNFGTNAKFTSYPNPFTEQATIEFAFDQEEEYSLNIYSIHGALIKTLKAGKAPAKTQVQVKWEDASTPRGVYLLRLATKSGVQTLRLVRE